MKEQNDKHGMAKALKFIYQEYEKNNFKVDPDMAMSVIYSLIMNIKNKDVLPYDHMETFGFMVDHLMDSLYE